MTAVRNDARYKIFIERLPINKFNVTKTALEAGFSKSFAEAQQKLILKQAMKYQLQNSGIDAKLDMKSNVPIERLKKTMSEIIGIDRESLLKNVKYLAEQDKDLSVRLKVITPLLKQHGIVLSDTEEDKIQPIFNITFKKQGSVEPDKTSTSSNTYFTTRHNDVDNSDSDGGSIQPDRLES